MFLSKKQMKEYKKNKENFYKLLDQIAYKIKNKENEISFEEKEEKDEK